MKKDKEWAFIELDKLFPTYTETHNYTDNIMDMKLELLNKVYDILTQLDEPEVLSQEWIDEHEEQEEMYGTYVVPVRKLENLLVPKQEEVDRAYKDGYDTGRMHATEKQSEETETVAMVLIDYLIASAKLKLALSMEVVEVKND